MRLIAITNVMMYKKTTRTLGLTVFRQLSPSDVAVVREVYDGDNSEDIFRMELERALQVGCRTIIIEPNSLAAETRRWITAGEYVRAAAVVSGLGAFGAGTGISYHCRGD